MTVLECKLIKEKEKSKFGIRRNIEILVKIWYEEKYCEFSQIW